MTSCVSACWLSLRLSFTEIAQEPENGEYSGLRRLPTPADAPAVVAIVEQLCAELLATATLPVAAIGIGSAGQVDVTRGVITYAVDTLPDWAGISLASRLQQRFGLPVYVDNDVNAMALGEAVFGAGRGVEAALYCDLPDGHVRKTS